MTTLSLKSKRIQLLAVLVCSLFPVFFLSAAQGEGPTYVWQRTGVSTGAVHHLAVSSGGAGSVLYAASAGLGILRSSDGGVTWQRADRGLPSGNLGETLVTALAASRQNPLLAFAAVQVGGGEGAIYRTTDGGVTWRLVGSDLGTTTIDALAVAAGDRAVYAVAGTRVFVSADNGSTWTEQGTWADAGRVRSIVADRWDAAVLYLAGSRGVLRSGDAGRTWRSVDAPMAVADGSLLVAQSGGGIAMMAGGQIAMIDAGVLGRQATMAIPGAGHPRAILGDDRQEVLVVATDTGVYLTTDSGASWRRLVGPLGMPVHALAWAWRGRLLAATGTGLWRCDVDLPALPPTLTPTRTATATATAKASATPTTPSTATPTASATPTQTPVSAPTATATLPPQPSPTATASATATLRPLPPTATPTTTPTAPPPAPPTATPVPPPPPPPPTATPQPPTPVPPTATPTVRRR